MTNVQNYVSFLAPETNNVHYPLQILRTCAICMPQSHFLTMSYLAVGFVKFIIDYSDVESTRLLNLLGFLAFSRFCASGFLWVFLVVCTNSLQAHACNKHEKRSLTRDVKPKKFPCDR